MSVLFDLVIKGKVVLENQVVSGEVGVINGKVASILVGENYLNGNKFLDFGDSYIFPGLIDTHVHCFSNPDEGFTTTSRSAAVGGITTILDMPYDLPNPINNTEMITKKIKKIGNEAVVDIGLWATISKVGGTDEIKPLAEAGAIAFKMSTFETDPYRFPRIPDPEILKALETIRETGLTAAFHAENDDIINDRINEYQKEGKVYPTAHAETRPPVTETSAVLKLLEFAYWTNAKLHIVHVSHPRTIQLIKLFRAQGVQVTCETCYTYLLLNVEDLIKFGPKAKMNPPLRKSQDVEQLWEHLCDHNIDLITSDHAPWNKQQKEIGKENIFRAASGLSGVQILAPLLFSHSVFTGKLTAVDFAKLLSQHPAEVFKIEGKGKIAIGYDADFTVIDPNQTTIINETLLKCNSKMTPFHGEELNGKVIQTIVRGVTVYNGSEIVVDPGFGTFIPGAATKTKNPNTGEDEIFEN
jgi:allantoinase